MTLVPTAIVIEFVDMYPGTPRLPTWPQRPGDNARLGDQILDVLTQGKLIEQGCPVRIIGHTGPNAVVDEVC